VSDDDRFVARLDVARVDPSRIALAVALLVLGIVLAIALAPTHAAVFNIVAPLILGGLVGLVHTWRTEREYAHVEATREALSVGDKRFPRERIRRAMLLPGRLGARPNVRVEIANRPVMQLGVRDEHEGRQLLPQEREARARG